jgi:hypothetical protein
MSAPERDQLATLLLSAMADAFNRSVNALEVAGALDLKKMRSEYAGVGSRYYDLVTEAMQLAVKQHKPAFEQFFTSCRESPSSGSTQ